MRWPDGSKYVGEFENGKMNGQRIITWANGDNLQELGKIIFNMAQENSIIQKLEKALQKNGEKVKSGLGKQLKMI